MIDLHLHLDGSLSAETAVKLAGMQGITLPAYDTASLTELMSVGQECADLNDYLKCFELPLTLLQSSEAVAFAVSQLRRELKDSGLVYAEIRFAPGLHTGKGASQRSIVSAAVKALKTAGVKAKLILCCMRGRGNESANLETVDIAAEFLGQGVAAVDLAGAEALYPTEDFEYIFKRANSLGVPFTIHAGEAAGADSVRCAVEFGAARIGHGVAAAKDAELVSLLAGRHIPLEMCPTSNVQTGAVPSVHEHPLKQLMKQGVPVTVNTDNMTVSNTDIFREYEILKLTETEKRILLQNSISAAFLDEDERKELLKMCFGADG